MSERYSQKKSPFKQKIRTMPHAEEAEMALLGSILINSNIIVEISHIVHKDSFYISKHKAIFDAMLKINERGDPVDLVTLSTYIKDNDMETSIGGISYLSELSEAVPTSANAIYYANQVAEKHLLREIINAGTTIAELGYKSSEDIAVIMDEAEKKIFSITQAPSGGRFYSAKEVIPEVWETIQRLQENSGEIRGVPTGFATLDKKLSGFQRSDLIILAARPSVGKTSLALDIARKSAVNHGTKVGIFSLEMSKDQLVERMMSAQSGIDLWKIRTGIKLKEQEYKQMSEAISDLTSSPIFIDDIPGNSILNMRSTARRLKREHGLDLIIVDYLQLMTTARRHDSMVNQVTEISRSLKALARELNVPVIALSQLSRAVESRGGKPRLSDLRDSGSIEQDADVVMFIHREDKNRPPEERTNIAEILIEKHRNGPTGTVELYFDDEKTSFLDMVNDDGYEQIAESVGAMSSQNDPFDEF